MMGPRETAPRAPEIRALTVREARALYRDHLRRDFPPDEVKPWPMIENAWRRGRYFARELCGDAGTDAYAFFFMEAGRETALLDYFAVVRGRRGEGFGSLFLKGLEREMIPRRCRTILIEAEAPEKARDGAERTLRQRRIAFYLRAGAVDTGLRYRVYGVPYVLMALGETQCTEDGIEGLYRRMLGERRCKARFRWEARGGAAGTEKG